MTAPASFPLPPRQVSTGRELVISIHDVSPLTFEPTRRILERLEALGPVRVSLLVIPDHHERGHFLEDPAFCHWLKERVALGDEAVIHGYHHFRKRRAHETLREKIVTRLYTASEGEFYDISGADALRVVTRARAEFRLLGLDPRGFIAPAWLLSKGAEQALAKLGFAYTTRLGSVIDLGCEREYRSQSLVWSVRSLWRRGCSRVWNRSLFRRLRAEPLLRVGIHPVDFAHRGVWRQVESLVQSALADREAIPYLRWVETHRRSFAHALPS